MYPHQAAGAAPALALHLGEPPSDGLGNIETRAVDLGISTKYHISTWVVLLATRYIRQLKKIITIIGAKKDPMAL